MNSRKNKSEADSAVSQPIYRGRFAPSATGPLHLGSLLTAVASYLDAKSNRGRWFLRMEDLDTLRCSEKAAQDILKTLAEHALNWDGEVLYQSLRTDYYARVLQRLINTGDIFRCTCSRRQLKGLSVYPGTCRELTACSGDAVDPEPQHCLRIRVNDVVTGVQDLIQGDFKQQLALEVGDFILRRRDGLFAYQLAVVADDEYQGITHIVRGADLLDNTPRQIYLQQQLGLRLPHYSHLPVILNRRGGKLSKQNFATAIKSSMASSNLLLCLDLLQQQPPGNLLRAQPEEILIWAVEHWDASKIPAHLSFQDVTGL